MLKTKRLILKAITKDHLPNYVTWLNDIEVTQTLGGLRFFNIDDETEWYEMQRKNKNTYNFAIHIKEGPHIGSIGLMNIDHKNQFCELGLFIGDKTQWNKGYATEAIICILDYGFNSLNLNRIFLRVDADNAAAIKCYQKCAFIKEGELRQIVFKNGKFINQYIMSILRTDYNKD